ncbi:hypothetical protein [Myxococcus sp. CA040A]|uniref:hypothetical protein n=1 Tax=Myxococcus sp. CA040A TaxID=2741738 RepID=UPI00157ABEDD|nr:hypothetical protein [Myxococcus sp. CA040A]NTX06253.1 hypothetical protein [Myxococcus sp. CA040A]
MRWMAVMLGLVCSGCAVLSRGLGVPIDEAGEPAPKEETVYLVPLADAMAMTRNILEEQRYDVFEKEGGLELFTSAHEPGKGSAGSRNFERYYVKGEKLGERRALVRVFRLSYSEIDTVAETPPLAAGVREEAHRNADGVDNPFKRDPFAGAPQVEGYRLARGNRDLGIERTLLQRLEMVPSLELVGGNASVPVRSVMMEEWAEEAPASVPEPDCGAPLAGTDVVMTAGATVLLADPLGTREVPSAALRLVCDATAKGLPVVLGLSIPSTEQALLDAYLASAGLASDAQTLLGNGSFWRRVYQDGRSSRAMLWLIEQVRRLRASGKDVSLLAFDADKASGNEREAWMARHVLDFQRQHAPAWTLVLAGGTHTRTQKVGWDSDFEPLGARLAGQLPSVQALDIGFQRGTQFSCRYSVWEDVECDVFAISPSKQTRHPVGQPASLELFGAPLPEGFHGRLYLGALSASPPALHAQARAPVDTPARATH